MNNLEVLYKQFHSFTEKMCRFLNTLRENFKVKLSYLFSGKNNTFEEKQSIISSQFKNLKNRFDKIKNLYYQVSNFEPGLIKPYFEELKSSHDEFITIYRASDSEIQKCDSIMKNQNKDSVNLTKLTNLIDSVIKKVNPTLEEFMKSEIYTSLSESKI